MRKVALSTIATISAGQSAPKQEEFSSCGTPFVRAGSLEDLLSGKAEMALELVPPATAKKRKLRLYPKGSILFAKSGMSASKNRIYSLQDAAYVVSHLAILMPKGNVHAEYLRLALQQFPPSTLIKDLAYPAISLGEIQNYEIPMPDSLDDQKRIAHLLGKVEGLITQRKQHLQHLDDLLKSVFLDMFGDPVRNEKGWETKRLPELIMPNKNSLKRGPFGGALKKDIFVESGYLVYEQNHALNNDYSFQRYFISEQKYKDLIDFRVVPGDILISCSGVYLGKLSIVPEGAKPGIINQALLKVSLNTAKMRQVFFVSIFGSAQMKRKYYPSNRGGGIPNLPPMTEMKKIDFICPPIELQNQFAAIVERIEDVKAHYQNSLIGFENLFNALSQKAFKGELDLSHIVLSAEHDETASDIADVQQTTIATETAEQIELSTPDINLIKELNTPEGRKATIGQWLNEYIDQLKGTTPFSADAFMTAAQHKLWELTQDGLFESEDESTPELGLTEYDMLTNLLFEALTRGRLKQEFEDNNNQVRILCHRGNNP